MLQRSQRDPDLILLDSAFAKAFGITLLPHPTPTVWIRHGSEAVGQRAIGDLAH